MTPATLDALRKRERELFHQMVEAGSNRKLKDAQSTYTRSSAVCKVAAHRALKKLGLPTTEARVHEIAELASPFRSCGEHITRLNIPKPSGGFRQVCSFGPVRRAADFIVTRMLRARFAPHADQYAVRGRGRQQACEAIAKALSNPNNERRWVVTCDLRDAYGSVDLAGSCNAGLIPIPHRAFSYLYQTHTCFGAKIVGIPQGAAVGSPVLAMVLHPVLDQLPYGSNVYSFEDDFAVLCGTEADAAGMYKALQDALHTLPGTLTPKFLSMANVGEGFDFLGYRFTVPADGPLVIEVAPKSLERLLERSLQRALAGASLDALRHYVMDWMASFTLAEVDDEMGLFIDDVPEDAWFTAKGEVAEIKQIVPLKPGAVYSFPPITSGDNDLLPWR